LENCIIISDTHAPYHHPDALKFLAAIKDNFNIKIAKHVGDVVDNHIPSYHETEPGTFNADDELKYAQNFCHKLAEIYPEMTVSLGNHDTMSRRKAKTAQMPEGFLRDYNQIYGVNWKWVERDYFRINKYNNCLMTHSISASTLNNAQKFSHCSIQGHHHGKYGIEYFSDAETLRWSMTVGCLINSSAPAFNYGNKAVLNRAMIGCGAIIEDRPLLIPMRLRKSGRWDGTIR
jgi:hypothetical protein